MNKNYFYIISAAILWGTIGIFIKFLTAAGLSSLQIVQLRSTFGLIFTLILLLITDINKLKIKLRDIWLFAGTGIASTFIFNFCYFQSVKSVGMAVASVLLYTAPVFVSIMSKIFFKENFNTAKIISLICAFAGCILVSGIGAVAVSRLNSYGVAIGIASGFAYSLYSIFGVFALRKYSSLTVTFYTFLFTSFFSFICASPAETASLIASPSVFSVAVLLGIITGSLPYFFYTKGLEKVDASKASILATIEPAVASIIGIAVFKEQLSPLGATGILMIFASSVLVNAGCKKKSQNS